jgi:hypothetical protein
MPPIHHPHNERAKARATNNIPQRHRDTRRPNELAHAESRPIKHPNRNQKVIRNAMLVAHRREGTNNDPDAVDLGRVVARLGGEEESQPDEPVAHDAARHVVAPVDVDAHFGLRDGVRGLRVGVEGVGPPEQNSRIEETAGDVEDVADDPVAGQVIHSRPPLEGRVGHYEHVARAELHVCEHDTDEAGWERESADVGCESGIAG